MKTKLLNIIMIVAVCVFCFSGYQLFEQTKDYRSGGKEYDKVEQEAVEIVSEETQESGTKEQKKEKKKIDKTLYRVDFEKLRQVNDEVVGWIRFDEPEVISYPLVQADDNDKYLTRTFEGNGNKVGALFLDRINEAKFEDENTFIYGHNMKDGSMFGRLRNYKKESFYKEYPYFYIYTPKGQVYTYQIFSVEITNDTSESFQKQFADDQEYLTYLKRIQNKALYDTGVQADASSKMVSLSTCTNVSEEERLVVHGIRVDIDKVK